MAIETWQEECRFAARRAMKEVLETRMHNTVDVHLDQMRAGGLPDSVEEQFLDIQLPLLVYLNYYKESSYQIIRIKKLGGSI